MPETTISVDAMTELLDGLDIAKPVIAETTEKVAIVDKALMNEVTAELTKVEDVLMAAVVAEMIEEPMEPAVQESKEEL